LIPEGRYEGEITQSQIVLRGESYSILEVYSATDEDGILNIFLYSKRVTVGFKEAQEIVKSRVGGRFWVKVAFQNTGFYYQLIIK